MYFGLIRSIQSIQSTLALLGLHWSKFYPLWSYSVYYVYFGAISSYYVQSVHFDPLQFYSGHLVSFGPFCPLWFYSVYYVLLSPHCFYLVQSVHFNPIRSNLVLFNPFCPLQSYSVHLVPIWLYSLHLVHFFPFDPIRSIQIIQFMLVDFDLFLCTYIVGKDMFGLKAPNLNPNLLKNKINLKLVISKILSIAFIVTTL